MVWKRVEKSSLFYFTFSILSLLIVSRKKQVYFLCGDMLVIEKFNQGR